MKINFLNIKSIAAISLAFFYPAVCFANPSVGLLSIWPGFTAIFLFFSVWIIETDVVNRIFFGNVRRALAATFTANVVTALVGAGYFILKYNKDLDINFGSLFVFFAVCYIVAVLIEAAVLYFFYRKNKLAQIFWVSAKMNLCSHVFTAILLAAEIFLVSQVIVFVALCYMFIKIYQFAGLGKNIPRPVLIMIAATAIIVLVFSLGSGLMYSGSSRSKARDARRIADMRQLITAQENYHNDNGFYYSSDLMPVAIGDFLSVVPLDPVQNSEYGFLSNAGVSDKFCYYAVLENKVNLTKNCEKGCSFYSATHKGNFYLQKSPNNFDECVGN